MYSVDGGFICLCENKKKTGALLVYGFIWCMLLHNNCSWVWFIVLSAVGFDGKWDVEICSS